MMITDEKPSFLGNTIGSSLTFEHLPDTDNKTDRNVKMSKQTLLAPLMMPLANKQNMKEQIMVLRVFVLLTFIALVGCAPPSTITPERTAEIKKVGVVTEIPKDELLVLDHTGIMGKSYTHGQFGALGALIETGILMGVREYRTSKSINGDTDKTKLLLPVLPLNQVLI